MVERINGKTILTTPISAEDLKGIKIGDIVYLNGSMTTCRDVAHRRLVEEGRELPVDVRNNAIFHAGPIIRPLENDKFEMVSVGPTTSMRMEKFEYEFVKETGVRVIIGKGGMKENTERACKEFGAIHCVFPAGNAVVAATEVEEIVRAEWRDLGMPETLWNCRVKEFGPLIVSIDAEGNNWFEQQKVEFNKKKRCSNRGNLQAGRIHQIVAGAWYQIYLDPNCHESILAKYIPAECGRKHKKYNFFAQRLSHNLTIMWELLDI